VREKISFSEWRLYQDVCQHRWKLNYIDGNYQNVYSIHMDFGTAIHESIEKHPVTQDDASKFFEEKFKSLLEKNQSKYPERDKKTEPGIFVEAGKRIIANLNDCQELVKAEVLYNEYELDVKIDRSDDADIRFKGYIDLVFKITDVKGKTILYVCDFKTCSWGWDKEKRRDRGVQSQLFLYKHFLCKKFNLDPKQVRCSFILLKKRPPKGSSPIEFFPISAGPISVQHALDDLNSDITDMRDRLKNETIQKNLKSCVNAYGDRCPYFQTKCWPDKKV